MGEEVLVYAKERKDWLCPFIVVDSPRGMVEVRSNDGANRQTFIKFQLKPYYRDFSENYVTFKSHQDSKRQHFTFLWTKVTKWKYPRYWKFDKGKKKEINGLPAQKTWKIVCCREISGDANSFTGRASLAIKH